MNLVDIEVRKREKEQQEEKRSRSLRTRKTMFVGLMFTVLFTLLMGRVFFIKMVHGEEYEREALKLQYNRNNKESVINPNRGSIVDRNNQSLALSYTVYKIILDISRLVEESDEVKTQTVENLHAYLDIPEYELRDLLLVDPATGKAVKNKQYHILKKDVPREVKNQLLESGVKHVYAEADTMRNYVHGDLASQIIGFIRGDGRWGLEEQYYEEMSGQEGRMVRYYDTRNNPVTEKKDPVDGYTLVTTIDTNIQRFAEEAALNAGIEFEAQNALVLVSNPMTGELLAMAQYPTFNLNDPANTKLFTNAWASRSIMDTEFPGAEPLGDALQQPDAAVHQQSELDKLYSVWKSYGISYSFEPGSIFKPITIAAALEEGRISKNDRYRCNGGKEVLGVLIPCWIRDYNTVHGEQTLTQVVANSCNEGLTDIGAALGRELFHKYQHDFGFGSFTGIDLPAEAPTAGMLYSVARLNPVEVAAGSIGQGFNCTAIQAVTAFSALINGGELMKPYVVSQVLDNNGAVIQENVPTVVRKVISRETSKYMREAMREVLTPEGTGKKAVIEGYAIGGKTGTAQQGVKHPDKEDEYVLSFMAYLPNDNPEIIVLALIDRPKEYIEGTTSPAAMIKSVLQKIITYKAIPPGEGSEAGVAALLRNSTTIDDYIGMRFKDVSKSLNAKGVDFECIGSGDKIVNQSPKPGAVGDAGSKLLLYLTESEADVELTLLQDVRNASIDTARDILEKAGFAVRIDIESKAMSADPSDPAANSTVITVYAQMPSGDIRLEPGTEIRLKAR